MKLHSYREKVGEYGNMTGQGALELLGASELNPLEIVLREAVQNSWDARLSQQDGVDFLVDAWTFKPPQKEVLTTAIDDDQLAYFAKQGDLDCLVLSDRRTTGLDGSVRPPTQSNFTRFAYLIGQTKVSMDEESPGGTYGFGRSAFLNASQINTVVVHSRCVEKGAYESRLIVMAWRRVEESETGRIWWGWEDKKWVGPLRGSEADKLATRIGLGIPGERETGTTIAIIAPRWGNDDDGESVSGVAADRRASLDVIKRAILWNCWPRMVSTPTIAFKLRWFGADSVLVDPRNDPCLSKFVRALNIIDGQPPIQPLERVEDAVHGTRKTTLGRTGLALFPALPVGPVLPRDIGKSLHHVALMRGNRLVVKYLPVAASLPPKFQLAGVFLASAKHDRDFADSEPPTHDDWKPGKLPKETSTIVRVAISRVKELADAVAFPTQPSGATAGYPLADMGNALGGLVLGAGGGGPTPLDDVRSPPGPRKKKGAAGRRATIEVGEPGFGRTNSDRQDVAIPFTVTAPTATTYLTAVLAVAVDGEDKEGSAARDALNPEITGWLVDGRPFLADADGTIVLEGKRVHKVQLLMSQPLDCVVDVDLVELAGGDA